MVQYGTVARGILAWRRQWPLRYTAIGCWVEARALESVLKEIDGVSDMHCDRDRITLNSPARARSPPALLATLVSRRTQVASFNAPRGRIGRSVPAKSASNRWIEAMPIFNNPIAWAQIRLMAGGRIWRSAAARMR